MAKTLTLRDWYTANYPEDSLGYQISPKANFLSLKQTLEMGKDVYVHIGVGDSLVRERLFQKLARICGVSYDTIYDIWLAGPDIRHADTTYGIVGLGA